MSITDRAFLKTIQLIEISIEREVRNEVERIFRLTAFIFALLNDERIVASEGIVPDSNLVAVADSMASLFER